MRDIEFNYIYNTNGSDKCFYKTFSLEDLESGGLISWFSGFLNGIKIIAKRQYTGLKDCCGVKIFEGDIVEHIPKFEANYHVKYLGSGFYLCPNNSNYGESFCSLFAGYNEETLICGSLKIIGNIYENPELLAKTENKS